MVDFNKDLALTFAKLSELAYDNKDIDLKLKELGFELVLWVGKAKELNSYLCKNKDYAVLVYEGTKDKDSIKADLTFWKLKVKGYKVDAGVYQEYIEHYPKYSEVLKSLNMPLYIAGHSLGGGLAGLTAILMDFDDFEAVYTYGGMRFCDKQGSKSKNCSKIFRVVLQNDIVPLLPPLSFGYSFVGKLFQISENGDFCTGKSAYFKRIFALTMPFLQRSLFLGLGYIKNHLLGNYIKALKNVVAQSK